MRPKTIANCTRSLVKGGAKNGIRLGARGLHEFRTAKISFGNSVGSCEAVLLPGTRVFAQASAAIGEPSDSRPGEGSFTISVWVSPAATGEMVGNSEKPSAIARTLERMFKENRAVDLESLCIKFGELAWILRVDVHVIDMNGCLQDAAALAVLGALLTFQRPQAQIDINTDELVVLPLAESTPVELHLFHLPAVTSFALCDDVLLAEPCQEEEDILPGKLLVGVNDSKELCHLHLTHPIDQELLLEATKLAQVQCLERLNMLKQLVEEVKAQREIPVYKRPKGPRTAGAELKLSAIEELSTSGPEQKPSMKYLSPLISTSDVNMLEELCIF
ncbi:Protein RRP45A [Orchesella cincta]|uniref:Protein RRP45A n=1 Tax=Orchesella cincta TaxID=48709 RepID=A0A1D2NIK0_ORCCI|nr:Protein RRP45A [Orchesella cincta]